jgi:N-carbamoylputrescine amidase
MAKKVNIGLVQMSCTSDVDANFQKATEKIREAAQKGANIICLQELFKSLYFCDVEDHGNFSLAEAIPGPSTESLGALAKELGVVIIASLFEKRAHGLYHNTTAVLDADGAYLGKYRKMHILPDIQYQICQNRRAHLLGSMVPRSGAHYQPHGRGNPLLPYRDRLGCE